MFFLCRFDLSFMIMIICVISFKFCKTRRLGDYTKYSTYGFVYSSFVIENEITILGECCAISHLKMQLQYEGSQILSFRVWYDCTEQNAGYASNIERTTFLSSFIMGFDWHHFDDDLDIHHQARNPRLLCMRSNCDTLYDNFDHNQGSSADIGIAIDI